MDALDVLLKARAEGGDARKKAIEDLLVASRLLGCSPLVSDPQDGGFRIRYGTIRYAVLDVTAQGRVNLYVKVHPSEQIPEELSERANAFIANLDGVTVKNGPISCYGQAEQVVESIPRKSLEQFLEYTVQTIQEHYYR